MLAGIAILEVPLLSGYIAGLELLRRWLRGDAGVEGRRSLIAGAVAPLAFFAVAIAVGGTGPFGLLLWGFLSGFATAVSLFFPWLRSGDGDEDVTESGGGSSPRMLDWDRP
jgi:hypothetical protein